MDGWEKKTSKFLQIPSGRAINPLAQTRVQFHQDQTHLLVVHETQIAIYEASKLECVKQVCNTYIWLLGACFWWVTIMLCPMLIWQTSYCCMVGDSTMIFQINRPPSHELGMIVKTSKKNIGTVFVGFSDPINSWKRGC